MKIRKTVETDGDPTFVISNVDETLTNGSAVLYIHYWTGEENEAIPRVTLDIDGAIFLSMRDMVALRDALNEFIGD